MSTNADNGTNDGGEPSPPMFIGVDVGTGSVRAGLFTAKGELLKKVEHPIQIWWGPQQGMVEQSSTGIWSAVIQAISGLFKNNDSYSADKVRGLGFCATCSMVVIDAHGEPLAVGPSNVPNRNVIVWMDQRATAQAARINAGGHSALDNVGGRISPEMQIPKLLWLKDHQPQTFNKAAHFFDLADFLTWKATGNTQRSLCTVSCKWTYQAHRQCWYATFFNSIGLDVLNEEGFSRIGASVVPIGTPLGTLSAVAQELGLPQNVVVGASMIDAHAGAMGSLWFSPTAAVESNNDDDGAEVDCCVEKRLALIVGTSACTIWLVPKSYGSISGIWGPYLSAVWPDYWLYEGGMTAFGSALQFMLKMHPHWQHLITASFNKDNAEHETEHFVDKNPSIDDSSCNRAEAIALAHLEKLSIQRLFDARWTALSALARLHWVPNVLGNRSPDADPGSTGLLVGVRLDKDDLSDNIDSLIDWYLVALLSLCYGVRDILETLETHTGRRIDELVVSGGGLSRNPVFLHALADGTGRVVRPPTSSTSEPMLLGAAIVGALGSHYFTGGWSEASLVMVHSGTDNDLIYPNPDCRAFHERKWAAFRELKKCELNTRTI